MTAGTVDYDDLLRRGVNTAVHSGGLYTPTQLGAKLAEVLDHDTALQVLARALIELAKPGRVGSLDGLRNGITAALYDNAHENCDYDESGCKAGGGQWWGKYVDDLIMPVVREHAVPAEALGGAS